MKEEKWFCDGCKKEMTDEMPEVELHGPMPASSFHAEAVLDNQEFCKACTARIQGLILQIQAEQPDEIPVCSFCDKPLNEVEKMIASPCSPSSHICNKCIQECGNFISGLSHGTVATIF